MEILRVLLLITKLTGVFLASVTLLGSHRLTNIEQNIRQKLIKRKHLPPVPYLPISVYRFIEKWKKFWDYGFIPFLFISIMTSATVLLIIWLGTTDNPKQAPIKFVVSVVIVFLPFLIPSLAFPIGFVSIIVETIVSLVKPKSESATSDDEESEFPHSQTEELENSQTETENQIIIVPYPSFYSDSQSVNIDEEPPREYLTFSVTKNVHEHENTHEQKKMGALLTIVLALNHYILGPILSILSLAPIMALTVSVSIALLPFVLFYLIVKYLIFGLHRFGIFAIPYMIIAIIGFIQVIIELSVIAISKPYEWLDKQVQKRQLESTLAVIGVIITVSSEIADYFLGR